MKEKKKKQIYNIHFYRSMHWEETYHSFLQIYHGEKQKETDLFIKKNKESYKL
jgi:hypothetical protein